MSPQSRSEPQNEREWSEQGLGIHIKETETLEEGEFTLEISARYL